MPSVGDGGATLHFLLLHVSGALQSPLAAQSLFASQRGVAASGPPQSTSVSPLFLMPSFGPAGLVGSATQRPPSQRPALQSVPTLQPWPTAHCGAPGPPQSTSVSSPFFVPSVGDAAWQMLSLQTPVRQSLPVVHVLPAGFALGFGSLEPPSGAPGS